MIIAKSERLTLRYLSDTDAEFILRLYNTKGFLNYIGDRNIRCLDDARDFLRNGPLRMYREKGMSLYRVELNQNGQVLGLCGLIQRDSLDDIDLGYAFLPEHCGKGYALESAKLILRYAKTELAINRVVAITQIDNQRSISLLKKLGMQREGLYANPDDSEEVKIDIYGLDLSRVDFGQIL